MQIHFLGVAGGCAVVSAWFWSSCGLGVSVGFSSIPFGKVGFAVSAGFVSAGFLSEVSLQPVLSPWF